MAKVKVSKKSVKASAMKSTKAKKSVKATKTAAPKRPPLSEEEVKALLKQHPEIRAFRSGTTEGRQMVRSSNAGEPMTSRHVGDEGAKFAATLQKMGLSFRQIEASMALAPHNGMTAHRLYKRGVKLLKADKRAANKAAKASDAPVVETDEVLVTANETADGIAIVTVPVETTETVAPVAVTEAVAEVAELETVPA